MIIVSFAGGNRSYAGTCDLPEGVELQDAADGSQQAFASIRRELRVLDRRDATTSGEFAQWLESAANRLEYLPVLGVDRRLVSFSLDAAQRLRNVGLMYRDVGMISSIYTTYHTTCAAYAGYYSYYFHWYCQSFPDYTSRRVALRDAALFRLNQTNNLRGDLASLRVCLIDDYNVDFK